jgi:hypothetical protein
MTQRHSSSLLLLIVLYLCGFPIRGAVHGVFFDIISPLHGKQYVQAAAEGLPIHIRLRGAGFPDEGYAKLFLDGHLIANMQDDELYLVMEGTDSLELGDHMLTVQMVDGADVPLGVEQYSSFTLISGNVQTQGGLQPANENGVVEQSWTEGTARAREDDIEADPCELDVSKTTAEGPGLTNASAGMSSQFSITPRSRSGNVIDPVKCVQPLPLVVVIVPAPLDHHMVRTEDGLYTCQWTAEYASDVKVEIRIEGRGDGAQHIRGSPWAVRVAPMYHVYAHGPLDPQPWEYAGHFRNTLEP